MSKLINKGMGLYIHIPFCVSKCAYCDFLSFEGVCEGVHERYVRALIAEMRYAVAGAPSVNLKALRSEVTKQTSKICNLSSSRSLDCFATLAMTEWPVDTVYIGGGTPTALPPHLLCEILREAQRFNLTPDAEITLEMNPSTNVSSVLSEYASHGVNRLSIGLQAWQDEFLRGLRRAHTSAEFTQTMQAARAAGIDNINVDLMFGLPWQSLWHWRESVTQVIAHAPAHISAYSLTPAENTPLWDALEAGKIGLPSESAERAMYHEAIRMLAEVGYEHYELSNFAKPGRESRHNVNCWLRKPYLGLGLGAHSFDGERRWRNTFDMGRYLDVWGVSGPGKEGTESAREDLENLSRRDAMAETMFLGLRMAKGVNPQEFFRIYGQQLSECYGKELEMLASKGLISYAPEKVTLTTLGMDLANQVFEVFL